MIRNIKVNNYKSIADLEFELTRVTVLIGANGSGKSNVLEAIALGSAASQDKLDNEFLISRGLRVTETRFMRSAFREQPEPPLAIRIKFKEGEEPTIDEPGNETIKVSVEGDDEVAFDYELWADETGSYPKWIRGPRGSFTDFAAILDKRNREKELSPDEYWSLLRETLETWANRPVGSLPTFLVYSPEFSALRTFQSEGQILPLGIRGEGLFAHLKALNSEHTRTRIVKIKETLKLIDWFEDFEVPDDLSPGERSIRIQDRYLPENILFDQRSANEGFLFLLFYLTLFISPDTPSFFSIDNIDSSLNPKLCTALVQNLIVLAKEYDKQVILTTHNPAVLDALNLDDKEQSLVVVERNKAGHTRIRKVVRNIDRAKTSSGQVEVNLSEAFLRGYLGGLPKNF